MPFMLANSQGMGSPWSTPYNYRSPYNYTPGQQVPGQSLYYAPSVLGGQMQHNWAFSPDMVAPLMRGLPTPQVQAQAFRMSNDNFMMPGGGARGGPRAIGSAGADDRPQPMRPLPSAGTQARSLRRAGRR